MAQILLGSTVAMIAGSIGGATFARNRYGAYIRNRTKPVDPGSNKQNEFRTRVSNAVAAWQALTAAQRNAFNIKAKTTDLTNRIGQTFHPSGINLFIRSYNLLSMADFPTGGAPPVTPIIGDGDTSATYTADPGLELNSDVANWPAQARILFWMIVNQTNSTYFYKGPYPESGHFKATDFTEDKILLRANGQLNADSSMFLMWRLIGIDGSASHTRRQRVFKPPA